MQALLVYTLFILNFCWPLNRQMEQELDRTPFKCSQPAAEQDTLISEAEKGRYTVRRVEFIGLTYTRDEVLRRRITILLQEGDLFTRDRLVRSLQNVSRLKAIYPVRQSHVVIQLDRTEKAIDMIICFRERRRSTSGRRRKAKPSARASRSWSSRLPAAAGSGSGREFQSGVQCVALLRAVGGV